MRVFILLLTALSFSVMAEVDKERWSHSFEKDKFDGFHIETATTDNGIAKMQLQRRAGMFSLNLFMYGGKFSCGEDCTVRIKLDDNKPETYIALGNKNERFLSVILNKRDVNNIKQSKVIDIETSVIDYGFNYNGKKIYSFLLLGNPFVGEVNANVEYIRKLVSSGKKPETLSTGDGGRKIESFETCKKVFYDYYNNKKYVSLIEREDARILVGFIYSSVGGVMLSCRDDVSEMTILEYM
ncbi:hypothetical protein C5E26_07885 [Pectobacterium parmentieri]|uniref:hypothetical protein n=1 Tax=Pectobacterium parmentieri TaxID=1905730 RepID=UPI000EAE428F|nr:hypothetical protein [Pectobacterium parmentieri]AYH00866.1 hypothetical protein C5E26_07885 [Pectobacterium parmentieri]